MSARPPAANGTPHANGSSRMPRPPLPAPEPQGPPQVPGFELLGELGRGDTGVVYKARQLAPDRVVALKVVTPGAPAAPKEAALFVAAGRAVQAIDHPNVAVVFEVGEAGGRPYLAMEHLAGGTLAARVRTAGQLAPADAAAIVAKVARAVQACHDRGVSHRNLKTANVLFDDAGEPKLTDFAPADPFARPDAPLNPAADVFALGSVLYECLTGRPPFKAATTALVRRIARQAPPSVRSHAPDVHRVLEAICQRCLAPDRHDRYPTAAEVAEDLERLLAGEPVHVPPPRSRRRSFRRWVKRAVPGWVPAVALLLAGWGGSLWIVWKNGESARRAAIAARNQRAELAAEAEAARADADLARGLLVGERQRANEAEARLAAEKAATAKANGEAEGLRAEVEKARGELAAAGERERSRREAETGAALGRWWAEALAAAEAERPRVALRPPNPDPAPPPAPAPAPVPPVRTVKVGELLVLRGHQRDVLVASFRHDGKRVATAGADGTARVWDAESGKELLTIRAHTGGTWSVAFSPDGKRLVTAGADGVARIWDAESGNELLALKGHPQGLAAAAFSPDGKRVVTAGADGAARVWDADTGTAAGVFAGHTGWVQSAAFSHDGTRLVTAGADGTARVWDTATGRTLDTLRGHAGVVWSAAFSPDGKRVATAGDDRTARVWDAETGKELLVLRGHAGRIDAAAFSPDGLLVVTASADGKAKVWDAETGKELASLPAHGAEVRWAAFRPDGAAVVTTANDGNARVWPITRPKP